MSESRTERALALAEDPTRMLEFPARAFAVRGSGGAPYVVVVDTKLNLATCTCPAGRERRQCYHAEAAGILISGHPPAAQAPSGGDVPEDAPW